MAHSDILSQPDRGLGLDRPQTEALLALFSRCDDLREFGREVIQSVVNALMDSGLATPIWTIPGGTAPPS